MRVAFIWQGFDGRYGKWADGLYAALKLIEQQHKVRYFDFPLKGIHEFNPDVVLYWEAPVTKRGKDAFNWFSVCELSYKKALLFAGGPLKSIDVADFDLVFVESQINEDDCEREGISYRRAFGVNTQIMQPKYLPARYDAIMQATFAEWKRHELFADAVGRNGLAVGRIQEHDRNGYNQCVKRGVKVMNELPSEDIAYLINSSYCVLNTSDAQGGGQRCTLEAMACGTPVIVMSDSPKNCEFVRESGAGLICEPDVESIRNAIDVVKSERMGERGFEYIQSKWTEKHYADALLEGIKSIV